MLSCVRFQSHSVSAQYIVYCDRSNSFVNPSSLQSLVTSVSTPTRRGEKPLQWWVCGRSQRVSRATTAILATASEHRSLPYYHPSNHTYPAITHRELHLLILIMAPATAKKQSSSSDVPIFLRSKFCLVSKYCAAVYG